MSELRIYLDLKKTPALWIHKVGVYKTVNLLHQFYGCEGFSFYLLIGIWSLSCSTKSIYSFSEIALLSKNHPKIIQIPG